MVLSFATRYGIHLRVATDNYLPEGMPSEVAEEMDSFIELTESPESPKTTTPLSGEPEDRVAANREAVQLL